MSVRGDLSVIVIPLIGGDALATCLDRLSSAGTETIVVLRSDMGSAGSWARGYPSATFLQAEREPVPFRRRQGLDAAGGTIVALLEDTSWPDVGWSEAIGRGFADPRTAAVGGPVRISASLRDRLQALGWSEYGAFAADRFQSRQGGSITASRLPGNNMAFRRNPLLEVLDGSDFGLIEGPACSALQARGYRIAYLPEMSVTYEVADERGAWLRSRFQHGRLYGALRSSGKGWPGRLALAGKAMLLPAVLSLRTAAAMTGSIPPHRMPLALLWVCLLASAWAIGEAAGALTGAGKSMEHWC